MNQTLNKILSAIHFLGLGFPLQKRLQGINSQEQIIDLQTEFRKKVSKHRGKLALKFHPDVYKGDNATAVMQDINAATDFLLGLTFTYRKPVVRPIVSYFYTSTSAATQTTTTNVYPSF